MAVHLSRAWASPASTRSWFPSTAPVHFSLTSASVMNMFFVPQLGSMIATMNGMVTQLHLQADQAGEFLRPVERNSAATVFPACTSRCARCRRTAFEQWVATARQSGPALDRESLRRAAAAEPERGAVHLSRRSRRPVSTISPLRNSRRAQARRRAAMPARFPPNREELNERAWQAHLGRDPLDQPIPLVAGGAVFVLVALRCPVDHHHRPSALSVERVDHQRRSQAHRRHVSAARRS